MTRSVFGDTPEAPFSPKPSSAEMNMRRSPPTRIPMIPLDNPVPSNDVIQEIGKFK